MRESQFFLKISKTAPADDVSANARLLEQAGFVQKVMAGVYTFLPLGYRVLAKIEQIIREEMNAVGGQEVSMPTLHPKENWLKTGRWDNFEVLFKVKSKHGQNYALGPTHEEIVTPMALPVISSYKDLPIAVYQIKTKFRDEIRAKSGLLRGREFRMKDLYSFHSSAEDLEAYYVKVAKSYHRLFKRFELDAIYTEAAGGTFSKFSHEFQVKIENGEDIFFRCLTCGIAKNREIFSDDIDCTNCGKTKWEKTTGSEVGNIFKLHKKFSSSFNLSFTDKDGCQKPVLMGCYGIGSTRLMGVVVEKFHDNKGIIWPETIAPYKVHLLCLEPSNSRVLKTAEKVYRVLQKAEIEVLYDDREVSPGVKFVDSDLIGTPNRLVVSKKSIQNQGIELKRRNQKITKIEKLSNLRKFLKEWG